MKLQLFASILVAFATTAMPALSQSKPAKKVEYFCQTSNGIPVTFARTPKETVEMIRWQSRFFSRSGYTPDQRCQEVTVRFQKHSDQGNLRYITTGKINNQNVMCVAPNKGGGCRADGLILTFEPQDDPQKVLVEIFNVSTRVRTAPVLRGQKQKVYIDVDEFLSNAASSRQATTQTEATKPVNTGNGGSSNSSQDGACSNPDSLFCSN